MGAPLQKAGGGLIRKLVGAVAKEAPELSRGAAAGRRAVVNIGLDIPGGGRLAPEEALSVLQRMGARPVRSFVAQSDTEPTLVVELDRVLNADEAHEVSALLKQEAIAQVDDAGNGDLFGPGADNWKPFNGDYFIAPSGRRLTEEIMAAGNPEAVPGGAAPDPVMEKLDEIAASLKKPEQAYGGGGLVEKAAKMLMGAADDVAKKPLRLYHGTDFPETFKHPSTTKSPMQLGLHLGTPEIADNFTGSVSASEITGGRPRVIPLDVDMKNPVRLRDNNGSWSPDAVYAQLVESGLIEHDPATFKRLRDLSRGRREQPDGSYLVDDEASYEAAREIKDIIRSIGHDGVVYTNRYEFPTLDATQRARARDRYELNDMTDEQFRAEFPEAVDSYIALDDAQVKSPFGEGEGVGFAGGGLVNKIGKGLIDMLDFTGVGKPRTVKIPEHGEVPALPIDEIDGAAEAYMKKFGIPGSHRIDQYPEFDPAFARRVAGEYDRAAHAPNDPKVRKAYDALLEETMAQYRALEDSGLDVRFLKDGMADPYAKSPAMGYADIVNNGRLWVFPTDQGYGSLDDIADNPLLKKVGRVGDKKDAVANDAFRVVHDAYGHFGPGNPFFRHQGEDRAWQHHGRMFTDEALPAMTAETRGQNSWLNFGPYGEQNRKALGADTIFADQKAAIMPPWVYEKDLGRMPRFADGGPVWSEEDSDIAAYEDLRDTVSRQPQDIQSMTHIGSKPTRDVKVDMPLLGGEYNFGPAPYDVADDKAAILQTGYDAKTIPLYFTPAAPAAAAWDVAEGVATGDPLQAGMAVAGAIPGKVYKAAYNAAKPYMKPAAATGAMAYALSGDDAEAGVFGRLGKWATSKEGREGMFEAMHLDAAGKKTPGEIMDATGWFKDTDGHWKYFRPSQGGFMWNTQGRTLGEVLNDPHLFKEYPEFSDIAFRRKNQEGAHFDAGGFNGPEIVLGDISKPGYHSPESGGPWGVTLHEVYHAKADKEGWPQGMSVLMGKDKAAKDMIRFLGNKQGSPDFALGQDMFKLLHSGEGLGFERYQAEVGEALARREQLMREMPPELLRGTTPNNQQYLDTPMSALFHPGEIATPDQYRTLLQHMDDKGAAADMMAAKGDVFFADTPPKKKPAPKRGKK